jgi:chitinase
MPLKQIATNGVELNKLIIGKPAKAKDVENGYMEPEKLADCVKQAKDSGWSGGLAVWRYPDADSPWITKAQGTAFPSWLVK